MRIESVQTFTVSMVRQNWLFVKITTDTGLYGWGEASIEGSEIATAAVIDDLARRYLIGEDPANIEKLWRLMYHAGFWKGGFIHMSAISGIDQALWDLAGKRLGVPTYILLGGKVRDKVRTYTHCLSKEDQGAEAEYLCYDLGFAGVKTGGETCEELDEHLNAVRTAIGPDKAIMVDNHGQPTVSEVRKRLKIASKYDLLFYEEPLPPENPEEYRRLKMNSYENPLAAGERTYTRFDARPLVQEHLIDFYQPDICHCGGISEIRRMASYAEVYHIKFAPHSPNGPVATAASIQVAAATQNFAILEFVSATYTMKDIYDMDLTARDGYFTIPDKPGLGIELDESKFELYPFTQRSGVPRHDEDGAVCEQ